MKSKIKKVFISYLSHQPCPFTRPHNSNFVTIHILLRHTSKTSGLNQGLANGLVNIGQGAVVGGAKSALTGNDIGEGMLSGALSKGTNAALNWGAGTLGNYFGGLFENNTSNLGGGNSMAF